MIGTKCLVVVTTPGARPENAGEEREVFGDAQDGDAATRQSGLDVDP